jgi:hypothetical protein
MNRDEAQNILLLYRPGTADSDDPQVIEALALAQQDVELARWFGEHCAQQEILRAKLRQIPVPAGLKEQIISEQAALTGIAARRRNVLAGVLAVAAIVVSLLVVSRTLIPRGAGTKDYNTLANYQGQMIGIASSAYRMDYSTNDLTQIRAYLAKNGAPAEYTVPAPLEKTATTGCAIESWGNARVSMICFRTGKALPPNQPGDLWLFVVDRTSVKNAPSAGPPQLARIHQLMTATWTQGDKLYLLGTEGDEQSVRRFL